MDVIIGNSITTSSSKIGENMPFVKRPEKNIVKSRNTSKVISNLFPVSIKKDLKFYCYAVSFEPEIDDDFTFKKRQIFNTIEIDVGKKYDIFVYTGNNLFASNYFDLVLTVSTKNPRTNVEYKITITPTKEKVDITKYDVGQFKSVKNITEEMFKKVLRANPDLEFYKNLFVQTSQKTQIASRNYTLNFYPGYTTGIHYLIDGVHLCVSLKNKILNSENCLKKIAEIRNSYGNLNTTQKEQFQREVNEFFEGRSCKTNYKKNNKNYRINSVTFEKNLSNIEFCHKGKKITMLDYYRIIKGETIKDTSQPLFEVLSRNQETGKEESIYLVPELCVLSGMDDSMVEDRDLMTNLSQYTKLVPKDRVTATNNFLNLMNSKKNKEVIMPAESNSNGGSNEGITTSSSTRSEKIKLPSPFEELARFNIGLSEPKEFNASYLNLPRLIAAGTEIQLNNNGCFQFRSKVESVKKLDKWICCYHRDDYSSAELLLTTMKKAAQTFKIPVGDPTWSENSSLNVKDWLRNLESSLSGIDTDGFVVFILSNKTKRFYKDIKKHSIGNGGKGYISQVITNSKLRDAKKAMSICSNIVKQINSKLGGTCYKISLDRDIANKTLMTIGVDSSHLKGKRTGVAMCSTINKDLTEYYTKEAIINEKNKESISFAVAAFIDEAVKEYFKKNRAFPGGIVIYRQGVSKEQKTMLNEEVTQIEDILSGNRTGTIIKIPIQYAYIIVNKKVNVKFFEKSGNNYSNSSPGLIISDVIVDPEIYEFYLQPQFVNEGCATPTNYHVAYGNLDIMEYIPKLTYDLCYNYANWQGPIRVPSVLKNAEKLAKLVAKEMNETLHESLSLKQVFL